MAKAEPVKLGFEDVTVDRDAEVPIGVQLAWALRSRIDDGRFKPGQQLPGLRELAEMTGVNVNTVRAVYQRLEQEDLIDSRQGSGTFVASKPRRPSAVATIAADAARAAQETGVEPREVAAALYVSPGSRPAPTNLAAEQRRLLREQISMLDRTLVEMEARYPGVAPPPTEDPDRVAPLGCSMSRSSSEYRPSWCGVYRCPNRDRSVGPRGGRPRRGARDRHEEESRSSTTEHPSCAGGRLRPVAQTYFLVMVFGVPLGLLAIAMLGSFLYRGGLRRVARLETHPFSEEGSRTPAQ